LYFTTDTGKIFLDTLNGRMSLGSTGVSVFFSNANNLSINADDSYSVPLRALDDDNVIPKKDDLIINIPDGRFFRVNYFSNLENNPFISCTLIAVSGSGSGGGNVGGGSSGIPDNPKTILVEYDDFQYSFLYGTPINLGLKATSRVTTTLNLSWSIVNGMGRTIDFGTKVLTSGVHTVLSDIGKNINPDDGYHKIIINITGLNANPYVEEITKVRYVRLELEKDSNNFTSEELYSGTVPFFVNVYGAIDKTLYVSVDDIPTNSIFMSASETGSKYVGIDCSKFSAGVHTITAYLEEVGGVKSNIIKTDFIYHPSTASDNTYIIITDYPETCLSYETPIIRYWVWDTRKGSNIENTIIQSVNGINEEVTETQVKGKSLEWSVTNLNSNQNNICEVTCNNVSRAVSIYCQHSNIFDETTDAAALLLNANGRSNNTSLERRLSWSFTDNNNNTVNANLIGFNWNSNGWMKDNQQRDCLRINNGASVEIPLKLFTDSKPSIGGFTFEFEFKPYNLYSYNLLTSSVNTDEDTSGDDDIVTVQRTFNAGLAAISYVDKGRNDFGFCCGTQDAFF
jgi:hypothetical protein